MNIKGDDVAVIGMSGEFPGADSIAEFWDNLRAGKESIRSLSDEELRNAGVAECDIGDNSYVKAAALLDDVDLFDPGFFKISPLEAEMMDPQLRRFLQCAWETLEDAGYVCRDAQNVGVFAGAGGVTTSYFANFINVNDRFEKVTAGSTHLGNDKDFLSTYVSYKLNLTGPSITVQTACSTSLVALHQARASLLSGECDMALAGGVTVRVPHVQGYHYQEGYIFSRSGHVQTFDAGADGVVFGSGVGLVLIKRLSDAVADGDNIHAVIKGSAIANDGKGKMSYAASSAKGQIACVRAALNSADVDAGSIGFVEAHGTGTAMGDPEEVKALSAAFRKQTGNTRYCALGAVKTNVGHLEAAAGVVAFIKAVLAVKHGEIPPTVHYSKPNPRIKFDDTPFYVNTELQQWNNGDRPRRAAVNSLGVGGTNAFVILENHVPARVAGKEPSNRNKPIEPVVVPLSAHSQASLNAYAGKLAGFIAMATERQESIDLEDLAYTLQVGRVAMKHRVAFVASSLDELRRDLGRYLEGEQITFPETEVGTLAASWVEGRDIDWMARYGDARPRRISLPTYAFDEERYWIENDSVSRAGARLHPLLHANTSDLTEQRYTSTFSGGESFLKDHNVRIKPDIDGGSSPQKVLPGVAYLEMARAAIEHTSPSHYRANELELRDIVWLRPIAVAAETRAHIALVARDPVEGSEPRVDFEVYTQDDQIHCQGRCQFSTEAAGERVDIEALAAAMQQGARSANTVYAAFEKMGLNYGPAHRSIAGIDRGDRELLARLSLPAQVRASQPDYVLHPSLLDGAFQAATTLLFNPDDAPGHPIVPFSLDALRIVAPCTGEMFVWARYADGSQPGDKAPRLDIDLLDADGNLCVRIRGLLPQSLGRETHGSLLATRVWRTSDAVEGQSAHAQRHVMLWGLPQVDAAGVAPECSVLEGGTGNDIASRYSELALACFGRVQALIRSKPQRETRVQIALPNTEAGAVCAGLSGLLKTAGLENPQIVGQIVLVDAGIDTDRLAAVLDTENGYRPEPLVKYERGQRYAAGWQVLPDDSADAFDTGGPFKEHGVYLITGGLGGLGVLFAREILARCANATIVLTGRAPLSQVKKSAGKKAILDSLQAEGASVEYRQLDLHSPRKAETLIASIRKRHGQLNGVFHSAGMIADDFILNKSAEDFRRVLAPKVAGAVHLDRATRDVDLDFLVLFSSLSSAVGNPGQADYAAANGFLDEFAAYRNRLMRAGERRGKTVAMRWPLWHDGGMQPDAAGRDMLYDIAGIRPMSTATGLRMFYRSLALGLDQTLAMEGDLAAMQKALGVGAASRAATPAAKAPASEAGAGAQADLAEQTEAFLCKQLSTLLKLPEHKVDARAPLEDYGIDSILALDLTRLLEKTFGPLPRTLFFEYLTLRELAGYFVNAHAATLATLFSGASSGAPEMPERAAASELSGAVTSIRSHSPRAAGKSALPHAGTDDIAIVGLSGRYPEARDLKEFWENLRDGKDCIVEVPESRWDWRDYYSEDRSEQGRHFSKWGGFIEGVDEFDARFFNISPAEAETIDPQERLFLQHTWTAIEDAGHTRASLQIPNGDDLPGQVGVYAGVMYNEYQLFGAEASLQGEPMGFASNIASIANRVSYVLNLHGPSMAVDTMCSSSLTAIHLACQDLKLGRTALGIAGGVNVTIHPNKYLMLSAGQFISSDGQCQSFGEGGDGYIPGEGVGVAVLKRLADAERDGNHIYGVIRGSALSHGGKTNGYTVPNPKAQASAIRQALAEADVDPRQIGYVEAHGTGTKLGDPIEITALSKVFQESTQDTGFCLIGSAKSNIGHAEAAAGIAGLTKVLLQLKHRQIVPSLHSSRLNPHIDFDSTPFIVNQALGPWEAPEVDGRRMPRIAGVSSFGAGGSNAHLIIEEHPQPVAQPAAGGEFIIPLSARTGEQLQQKARDLVEFVRGANEPPALASVAYTLQVGREEMDERLAVLADSLDELVRRLQGYLDGETVEGVYAGQVKANKDALLSLEQDPDRHATLDKWIAEGRYSKLADLWAKGLELDWQRFYGTKPPLISLPTYPFARKRFWIDAAVTARRATTAPTTTALHPLLHRNSSDFDQQSYTSTFTGDEFFLAGEPGQRCLTEAGCLEMARAAVELSMPADPHGRILELLDVAWAQPGGVVDGRPVTIALFDRLGDQVTFEVYSGRDDAEVVLSQGLARYSDQPAAARLDLNEIASQGGQVLTELEAVGSEQREAETYVLHPTLIQSALRAAAALTGGLSRPFEATSLRVFSSSTGAKFAWVRPANGAQRKIDIDLCDEHGHVCVQMHGLRYQQAAAPAVETPAASNHGDAPAAPADTGSATLAAEPTRIDFDASSSVDVDTPTPEKPQGSIALSEPESSAPVASEPGPVDKPRVALTAVTITAASPVTQEASSVALFDYGNGVFAIRINAAGNGNELSEEVIDELLRAMRTVEGMPSAKVLMIEGGDSCFLSGGLEAHRNALAARLYQTIVEFPYPVVAVVDGDAAGAGFLVAAVSDFMVCSDSGRYALAVPEQGLYPNAAEELLIERFGRRHATDFLYLTTAATGTELKAKGWTCPILPRDQVTAYGRELAADLAAKPRTALRLLKGHLARNVDAAVQALPDAGGSLPVDEQAESIAIDALSHRLRLRVHGEHTLLVTIPAETDGFTTKQLMAELKIVLAGVDKGSVYRSVVLASEFDSFLPEVVEADRAEVIKGFRNALFSFSRPVVAAVTGNATGVAWYVTQLCDACVYSDQGHYSGADCLFEAGVAGEAAAMLALRFGSEAGKQLLFAGAEATGAELRDDYGALHVVDADAVLDQALALGNALATLPAPVLSDWKQRTVSLLQAEAEGLGEAFVPQEPADGDTGPKASAVALESDVVSATAHPDGVLEVHMADREAKNTFSEAFSRGMREVFTHVEDSGAYKVVVLTGYDNYFSAGGTRETLLAIQAGTAQFTDNTVFQLPLTCSIPVIAAMQGHGIGAGWAMGMYADVALFSDESRYVSPYMGYGFTPGAGSTLMLPEKIGYDLGRETLLTAREYAGGELAERGLPNPVVPRDRVLPAAMALARRIAQSPRDRLVAVKRHWAEPLRAAVQAVFERELAMHEHTFVGQAETLARIQDRFTEDTAPAAEAVAPSAAPASLNAPAEEQDLGGLIADLRKMLAQELRMDETEIGDDEPFIDLGLDSITGVTWIRKINETYGTSIEAIKVYSYPTLEQLARFVLDQMPEAAKPAAVPASSAAAATTVSEEATATLPATAEAAPHGDVSAITTTLRSLLAQELRMEEAEIGNDEPFIDLGLDSITGVTWVRKINETYGTSIEAIKVYSYPTLAELSHYVREEAGQAGTLTAAAPQAATAQAPVEAPSGPERVVLTSWRDRRRTKAAATGAAPGLQPIAVVGMAGQFPKAGDLSTFWQNIAEGRDCIEEVPAERWDIDRYYQEGEIVPGKTYSRWMGALEEYDRFDAEFFNISPREARSMDPQQRLFLQACWHGIEHAGYNPKALAGSRCGVFVGCSAGDYHQLSRREQVSGQGFTGAAPSILAARVSYFLDLKGPSLSIDTACSSSLVAMANACDSLVAGGSDIALAGGVNVMAGPAMQVMTAQVGMLSPQGRCFTFDERADGIVNGEGVGVTMLKRLADAERDGDCIYGVVEGWGINQDGRTNGITAPDADSQARLQQDVYERFGIDPAGIQLVEAHGTGTGLGDPIEVAGLKTSFKKHTQNTGYCALGSVKSNVGHCLTAAGVSGFLKILLALKHEQLPPTIHFRKLNGHIALQDSPFYINDRLREWKRDGDAPRRAAINSFGFSGTNAHIVVAEHRGRAESVASEAPVLVPLSARTADQLQRVAQDLLGFVRSPEADGVDLARIAYTLQVGRQPMDERAAFIANTRAELADKLQAFVDSEDGGIKVEQVYRGRVSDSDNTLRELSADADFRIVIDKWIERKALPRLADLWVKGLTLDWNALYAATGAPRRAGLPGYPFAKQRYWIEAESDTHGAVPGGAALHPLLHVNTSDLTRQQYSTTLAGDEFFLVDRDPSGVSRRRGMPPSACLEMALAAVADAVPGLGGDEGLELLDIEWGAPAEAGKVSIALSSERGRIVFEIFSGEEQETVVHCHGLVAPRREDTAPSLDLALLQGRMREGQTPERLYDTLKHAGAGYGAGMRAMSEIRAGNDELLVRLALPAAAERRFDDFRLHPSLLEGAVMVGLVLLDDSGASLSPVAIESVDIVSGCAPEMVAWARFSEADRRLADVDLCDRDGNVCVQFKGLAREQEAFEANRAAAAEPAPVETQPAAVAAWPAPADAQPAIALPQLQNELKTSLADALYMKPADVDVNKSFTELGLDSIIGVEWVNALNKQYGTEISATRVYDYPTVTELAAYLQTRIGPAEVEAPDTAGTIATPEPQSVLQTQASPGITFEALQQQLKASLAEALYMEPADVDVNKSFTDLGLDSIIGVEWVKALNTRYGTELQATRVYDYPSVKELASFLIEQLPGAEITQPEASAAVATAVEHNETPVSQADTPTPTAGTVERARKPAAGRFTGLARRNRIRFEPKYTGAFKNLYFYSADCEGDFDTEGEFAVQWAFNPDTNVCLKEHVVFGEHLLPTDAYIELVYSAYRTYFSAENVHLKNIAIVNPMLGAKGRNIHVRVVFRQVGDGLQFFVRSSPTAAFDNDQLHVHGAIAIASGESVAGRFDDAFAVEKTLARAEIPTNAGTYYAPLEMLQFGESSALGLIRVAPHEFHFLVSPFALYGGLCTVINYGAYLAERDYGASDDQFLPYRIGGITMLGSLESDEYRCYAQVRKIEQDGVELYFEIVDAENKPVLVVDSISLRRVARETVQQQALTAAKRLPASDGRQPSSGGAAAEKVAIIGMSCRYPMSEDVDAFWENLKAGRDCIVEVPDGRWGSEPGWYHPDPQHPHTSYSKWGGFIDNVDAFDALFFGIAPSDAEVIDPQQRLFLEESWKTIENAGYAPGALSNQACGVYVGCSTGDYAKVLADEGQDTVGAAFMGTSNAILAARIAYHLNLKGPAMAVDTACSSSLVSVHLACESIRNGESRLALAGGINLLTTPIGHILTAQVGMPSRDGRCAAFDASANGIVFSEGCGVLLLKALSEAERDNDNILGVIQGSGTNQDGKTNGITAPSSNAQDRLLRQVYERFDIDPTRLGYVEAHGTATPLGDPIEVNALSSVFGDYTSQQRYCALGSVKSNIGHTGFAAGVAGIVKALLCIKHKKLVPSIHYAEPNPHIDFEKSPFFVNTQCRDWVSDRPRMAAVSSFGFSGTNAHVVIEEHISAFEPVHNGGAPRGKVLVPLSAKTADRLERKVRDLLAFIDTREEPVDLARMSYTLQAGRDAMDHRLSVIVDSVDQLTDKLQAWLDGQRHIEDVYHGQTSRGDDTLAAFAADAEMRKVFERWITQKNLPKLADLWVRGFDFDWERLHDGAKPRRMTLPTYPFARERCWVTASGPRRSAAAGTDTATLHPLLHRNTSDLTQQRYTSLFSGDEFFLADHRVNDQRVLPAVAYLEMARAALLDALPAEEPAPAIELRHVVFAQPITVTEAKSVAIAVFPEDGEQLGFEVYSRDGEGNDETLHCQGSGVIEDRGAAPTLDVESLRSQMSREKLTGAGLYPAFAAMGLGYGPAFQGIETIHRGDEQLLVELNLPDAGRASGSDYVLHPSVMDSALQGSIALIDDLGRGGKPSLPFALDSLRVHAACSERMLAWVRYAPGGGSSGLVKVDIDLCDTDGNVCVQMQGFSSRPAKSGAEFDEDHYQAIIAGIVNNEISTDEAVELG